MNNTSESLRTLAESAQLREHPVLALLPRELADVEAQLGNLGGPPPLDEICADLFVAGGKRLRAMLALWVSQALGVPKEVAVSIAAATEATHGATLLHDDVIDEADERRSRPAARRRWCNTLSVLGGDHLLLTALRKVWRLGSPALFELHMDTLDAVLAAEVAQHQAKEGWDTTTRNYVAIARGKTGVLFAFACAGPAAFVGDDHRKQALHAFGLSLGLAFQIADDLKDVLGLDPTKPVGLDLADGVLSLPLRLAVRLDPTLEAGLRAGLRGELAATDVPALLARVKATDAVARASRLAHAHLAKANSILAQVGVGEKLAPLAAVSGGLARELTSMRGQLVG